MSNQLTEGVVGQQPTNPSPNAYTIGRFGDLLEGIKINREQTQKGKYSLEPYIRVGGIQVPRDRHSGCECVYTEHGGEVRRVTVRKVTPSGGKNSFYTLRRPASDELLTYSLIKINLGLGTKEQTLKVGEFSLGIYTGFRGRVQVVARSGIEVLLVLDDGSSVDLFFPDGHVRSLRQKGSKLVEVPLTREEMFALRIADALQRLAYSRGINEVKHREWVLTSVLLGMADLLMLTSQYRGSGKALRVLLMEEFFLRLPPRELNIVHRKLNAILHRIDLELVRLITREAGYGDWCT